MKRQFERYFELFPILAIILIMMAGERRQLKLQNGDFGFSAPSMNLQVPRIIFR